MSGSGGFFRPLGQAWDLAKNPISLAVLAALVLVTAGNQFAMMQVIATWGATGVGIYSLLSGFVLLLFMGAVLLVIGRKVLGGAGGSVPSAGAKFVALLAIYGVVRSIMRFFLNMATIGWADDSTFPIITLLAAAVPSILLFGLIVRLIALARPAPQPRLGRAFGAVWSSHFDYLAWYALVLVLPSLAQLAVVSGPLANGGEMGQAAGALIQGIISGPMQLAAFLIAAAAARELAPEGQSTADVFS